MKKFIVAALAVAMMSSVACAALLPVGEGDNGFPTKKNPGSSIKIGAGDFWNGTYDATAGTWTVDEVINDEIDFTDEYFVVSSKKFTKGASLVKSIAFVDDGTDGYCLKISLNQDYNNDISRYTNANAAYSNLVFSDLSIKAKKTVKDADDHKILSKGKEYKFRGDGKLYGQIGYKFTADPAATAQATLNRGYGKVKLDSDDYDLTVKYDTSMPFKFVASTVNETVYAYAVINANYGDIAYTEGRVYDGDKVIYNYTQAVTTSVLKAYPDAELEFVNMKTSDLPATCYFELYADEDEYVYKLENGKLVKSGLKWDEDVYAWVGKYRTPCTYVISDIPLSLTPARDEVTVSDIEVIAPIEVVPSVPVVVVNPETGR